MSSFESHEEFQNWVPGQWASNDIGADVTIPSKGVVSEKIERIVEDSDVVTAFLDSIQYTEAEKPIEDEERIVGKIRDVLRKEVGQRKPVVTEKPRVRSPSPGKIVTTREHRDLWEDKGIFDIPQEAKDAWENEIKPAIQRSDIETNEDLIRWFKEEASPKAKEAWRKHISPNLKKFGNALHQKWEKFAPAAKEKVASAYKKLKEEFGHPEKDVELPEELKKPILKEEKEELPKELEDTIL